MLAARRRPGLTLSLLCASVFLISIVYFSHSSWPAPSFSGIAQLEPASEQIDHLEQDDQSIDYPARNASSGHSGFHFLLPATNREVNLCKLLLTSTALDYPTPTLIAWENDFSKDGLLGGGSHVAKITGVLKYLQSVDASKDDGLVVMIDAYDIWFQLRPETLISRYHAINDASNLRLRERLGRAVDAEGLEQTIIFGAGKRCAPNQVHTVACYPIPVSPLPDDLYGENTDTIMGRNKYTSLRQRYLNSGYIIGPVKNMRRLFERAQQKVDETERHPLWDNGSNGADLMYHGSDQSIFNIILGEQEFQREAMRRRHRTLEDEEAGIAPTPPPTWIEGTLIDDMLNPHFTHEPMEEKEGKPDEFGLGLDYFSELGQQTVNCEEDAEWITYSKDIEPQISGRHGHFDCPSRVTGELPSDILDSRKAFAQLPGDESLSERSWQDISLYTNLCLNTVPVMIHHNGNKDARRFSWERLWLQPHIREMLEQELPSRNNVIAYANDESRGWDEICPERMNQELFRDS